MLNPMEALGRLIAAVDFEATYIALEADDEEVKKRARIMLDRANDARTTYNNMIRYPDEAM